MPRGNFAEWNFGLYPTILAQEILRDKYNDKNDNKYNNTNTR